MLLDPGCPLKLSIILYSFRGPEKVPDAKVRKKKIIPILTQKGPSPDG